MEVIIDLSFSPDELLSKNKEEIVSIACTLREMLRGKEEEAYLAANLGKVLLEKNDQLFKENSNLQTILKEQYTTMEQSRGATEELRVLLQSKDKLEAESQGANEQLNMEVNALKQQLSMHRLALKENDVVMKRNKELQAQVENYESKLEVMQLQEEKLKKQIRILEAEKEEFKEITKQTERKLAAAKLEAATTKADKIQYDVAFLQNHITQLEADNKNLNEEIISNKKTFENKIRLLNNQIQYLNTEKQKHDEELSRAQEELRLLKDREEEERINRFRNLSISKSKTSILDELLQLEEQVAIRVQKELGSYSNPSTPTIQNETIPLPNFVAEDSKENTGNLNSNTAWMNFMSYLPWLKSINSTKELVNKMTDQQLSEFANVLSKVVNAYSARLIEVLQEREEIKNEREFRVLIIQQLQQKKEQAATPKEPDPPVD